MKKLLDQIYLKISEIFSPEIIGDLLAEGIIDIAVLLSVLLAFYLLWRVTKLISKPIFEKTNLDETTTVFANSIIKYGILIFGLITALDSIGIKTSAVLASLGIVGLTIGFAARDSLSNIISGIIIYLDRPFVIGDLVEIEDKYGKVDRITLRSTRIVTVDGKMLAVPNVDVVNKTVASYTNFPHLRLDIQVTVGVNEDLDKARSILLRLVENNPIYMSEPVPSVVVKELNDYNVLIELRVWIDNERDHIPMRFQLRENIFKAFNKAGIHMPYETLQLAPFNASINSKN